MVKQMPREVLCKHFETMSFSMGFQGHESMSIWNCNNKIPDNETVSGIVFYLCNGCNTSPIIFFTFAWLAWLAWLAGSLARWLALYPTSHIDAAGWTWWNCWLPDNLFGLRTLNHLYAGRSLLGYEPAHDAGGLHLLLNSWTTAVCFDRFVIGHCKRFDVSSVIAIRQSQSTLTKGLTYLLRAFTSSTLWLIIYCCEREKRASSNTNPAE